MNSSSHTFLNHLKNSFEQKCQKNSGYSLRSYAKSLGMSPGALSRVLTGKRKPTVNMIKKIGPALGLQSQEIVAYQKELLGFELSESKQKYNDLSQDIFSVIADWYHLSILEVMKLADFKPNTKWIACKLDVNVNQIKLAIERLERVGILEITKNGIWIDKTNGFTTHYQKLNTSEARKMYQMQLLDKSRESLLNDSYLIRDHSGMTMAIDSEDIIKAKDLITNFRKELSSLLESSKKSKNEVYQLQIGLFPITKSNTWEKK